MKKALLPCVAFIITILLSACGGSDDLLAGRWEFVEAVHNPQLLPQAQAGTVDVEIISRRYELHGDFMGVYIVEVTFNGEYYKREGYPFTWSRYDGNLILIHAYGLEQTLSYEYSDGILSLSARVPGFTPGSRTTYTRIYRRVTGLE